jgi:hypothetical protein
VSNILRCPIKVSEKCSSFLVKCKSLDFSFLQIVNDFDFLEDLNDLAQDLKLILAIKNMISFILYFKRY